MRMATSVAEMAGSSAAPRRGSSIVRSVAITTSNRLVATLGGAVSGTRLACSLDTKHGVAGLIVRI